MRALAICVVCFPLATLTTMVSAAEIRVPEDQASIQAAVNAAVNGDTVSIASGTYSITTPINVLNKSISITGRAGAENTILDAGGGDTVMIIQNAGSGSSVSGLYFRNGQATQTQHGGCLALRNAQTTVSSSIFENCQTIDGNASSSGGAIKVTDDPNASIRSNPLIQTSHFSNNRSYSQGGAIHIIGATGRVVGNVFDSNEARGEPESGGGGVKATQTIGAPVDVRDNTFENNIASFAGSAISAFGSSMTIDNNIIRNNGPGRFGGGIHAESLVGSGGDVDVVITDNLIEGNTITNVAINGINPAFDKVSGAGIHINYGVGSDFTASTAVIRNNTITDNSAEDSRCTDGFSSDTCAYGGGIIFFNGRDALHIVEDNLINNNISDVYAAGAFDKVQLQFHDNEINNNLAKFTHPGIGCVSNSAANAVDCDIQRNRFTDNRYTAAGSGTGSLNDAGALNIRRNSVTAINNLFVRNTGHFATLFIRHDDVPGAFSDVTHNTFVDNIETSTSFGSLMLRGDGSITANAFDGGYRALRLDNYTAASEIIENNITAMDNSLARLGTTSYTDIGAFNAQPVATGNTALASGFVDANADNYRLLASSGLVDLVSCVAGVVVDLDGEDRPFGASCDAGAYEYFVDDTIFADRFQAL